MILGNIYDGLNMYNSGLVRMRDLILKNVKALDVENFLNGFWEIVKFIRTQNLGLCQIRY